MRKLIADARNDLQPVATLIDMVEGLSENGPDDALEDADTGLSRCLTKLTQIESVWRELTAVLGLAPDASAACVLETCEQMRRPRRLENHFLDSKAGR